MSHEPIDLHDDWFHGSIPANIQVGRDAYVDTSYSFDAFHSQAPLGLLLGEAAGVYLRASFITGKNAKIEVGNYTCLNGSYLVCADSIHIGNYCLLSWGVVITDCWPTAASTRETRRQALQNANRDQLQPSLINAESAPVKIDDNVWIGFDAVVMPGVTIGQGAVVGCKSVVCSDVEPYQVVVGNPARVVRQLEPSDRPPTLE